MALTPTTLRRESMGSLTLFIANFASVSSAAAGDTWSTGLPNIVNAWASVADATTTNSKDIGCSFVSSTGVITLQPTNGTAITANVFVLASA